LLSCYFSACNIALKSFSRMRLAEVLGERGRADSVDHAELFGRRIGDLMLMTGTLRTCLNLSALLSLLILFHHRLAHWPLVWQNVTAFVVTALLVSVFSVGIPVSWARYRRERLLAGSRGVLMALLVVTLPITAFLHLFDPIVRRISGVDLTDNGNDEIAEQVRSVVEDHHNAQAVDDDQKEMIEAVFELPTTTVGEIMTPRTEIVGLEVTAGLDDVKRAVLEKGYSRVPVYRDSLDHIVGLLYAKDLLRFLRGDGTVERIELAKVVREPMMVPESKSISDLLSEFKARKIHVAIVLDEYGGTAGLVTIEDIIEELVGEIQDEYEPSEHVPTIKAVGERVYEVDARVEVDQFADELHVQMPEDRDYDTVGGFVIATLGHIPKVGEQFEHQGLRVHVTGAERTRVTRVRVERLEPEPSAAATSSAS
jgi:putative hemolysin